MSDSPLPPKRPLWNRIFNSLRWRLRRSVSVAVENLRPDAAYARLILLAVYDIRLWEKTFDGWMAQLNSVTISKKPDKVEDLLRFYLSELSCNAGRCSRATNAILQCHAQFSSLMAQRMDDMSKSRFMRLNYDSETTRLADNIRRTSQELSLYVEHMNDNLKLFVSTIQATIQATRKEQTLLEWILGWLKSFINELARIIVTFGPITTPLLHSIAPNASWVEPAASTLYTVAHKVHIANSEPDKGNEFESLESMLLFLKDIFPNEAQITQNRLERLDDVLIVMELEERMKMGEKVVLYGQDPATVAREWRDVANQYQSVLPDDRDPHC